MYNVCEHESIVNLFIFNIQDTYLVTEYYDFYTYVGP